MSPNITQKCSKLHVSSLETSGKHSFPLMLLRGKCINQKKLNVKTLPTPYTKRTHQKAHFKMCHLGMLAEQTHSLKLIIFCLFLY